MESYENITVKATKIVDATELNVLDTEYSADSEIVHTKEQGTKIPELPDSSNPQPVNITLLLSKVNDLASRVCRLEEVHSTVPELLTLQTKITTDPPIAFKADQGYDESNVVKMPLLSSQSEDGPVYGTSVRESFPQFYFRDLMTSVSLPGLRYIGDQYYQHWVHSYFWIFIHFTALLISSILIKEQYDELTRSPVSLSTSNNQTFVNEIPFPAVTICLPSSLNSDYNYSSLMEKCGLCEDSGFYDCTSLCTAGEIASMVLASRICRHSNEKFLKFIYAAEAKYIYNIEDLLANAKKVFPPCDSLVVNSITGSHSEEEMGPFFSLTSQAADCGERFQHFLSDKDEMCFTINGLKHDDIFKGNTHMFSPIRPKSDFTKDYIGSNLTSESMIYYEGNIYSTPPYLSINHTAKYTLFAINETSRSLCTAESILGDVKYIIHNPLEIPFQANSGLNLELGVLKQIFVTPELITTEGGLNNYKPSERGCFYSYERELSLFKRYSENNCNTECLANCSLHKCGCVPYYLPRHNHSVDFCLSDCSWANIGCDCECLPECYSLTYKTEEFVIPVPLYSELQITYKKNGFYATIRVSMNSVSQFMAIGIGIVAMFNGFSLMVLFELVYQLTFKLWATVNSYFK